jgi:hypothetical protein
MRPHDSDFLVSSHGAGRIDSIGNSGYRDAQPGPSYVQSVLFGKRRPHGTHALPLPAPHSATTVRVNALMPGAGRTADTARVTPEPERT